MNLTFSSPMPNMSQLQREAYGQGRRHVATMIAELHRADDNGYCIACDYGYPCTTIKLITPYLPTETTQ